MRVLSIVPSFYKQARLPVRPYRGRAQSRLDCESRDEDNPGGRIDFSDLVERGDFLRPVVLDQLPIVYSGPLRDTNLVGTEWQGIEFQLSIYKS
jgi:hypothetical protein